MSCWLFTAQWSTWPGNHLVPCVAKFVYFDGHRNIVIRQLSLSTKTCIYQTLVVSILLYASETWTLLAADVKTLQAFHMKCQWQLLRIHWHDHVCNDEVVACTGLRPVMESIRRRREAIIGHVTRMSPNIPAHRALRLQVEASVGRRPDRDWVRSSGRPRNRWIDQLRQDHQRPPADEQPSGVVTLERRCGPRRLRDDDDDELPNQTLQENY